MIHNRGPGTGNGLADVMSVKKTDKNQIGKGKAGPGRPKGMVNKTTGLLKDAILQAAQNAGGGGKEGMVNYLTDQAANNPGPFMALLGKVLPTQTVGAGDDGEHIHIVKLVAVKANG